MVSVQFTSAKPIARCNLSFNFRMLVVSRHLKVAMAFDFGRLSLLICRLFDLKYSYDMQ